MSVITDGKPATVKVYAANETMRQALRHGNGTRFRDQLDQPVEWPNDSFTSRRIKDGSVRTDGPGAAEEPPLDDSLNARQQAAARTAKQEKQDKQEPPKSSSKPQHQPASA